MPGMRMSLMMTSGRSESMRSMSWSPSEKLSLSMPAWLSARSSTQRIELSSSTTQTLACLCMVLIHW